MNIFKKKNIEKKYDIAITGDLLSVDLTFAKKISKHSLKILILRHESLKNSTCFYTEDNNVDQSSITIKYYKNTPSYIHLITQCRLICSFTSSFPLIMGKLYPIKFLPGFPPIVNIATGSDATELLSEKSKAGWLYRYHLNHSALNWMVEYPHSIKNIFKFRIKNVHLWPFPALHVCTDSFPEKKNQSQILFAHTSRIDFKTNDTGSHRNSTKGSDRFIRSFIKAVKNKKINAKCILVNHGPDAKEALKIINENNAQDFFIIKEKMPRHELLKVFSESDIVVDQFDVGGFGGTAIEAMSGGRAIMIHLHTENIKLLFGGDLPPVLNCWSEDEIYKKILECNNISYIRKLGAESREWVYRHYDSSNVINNFIFHYTLITGHVVKDYGWNRSAYE